jgi:hypothetical protein
MSPKSFRQIQTLPTINKTNEKINAQNHFRRPAPTQLTPSPRKIMNISRIFIETPCGHVVQMESGIIFFEFLGQDIHFPCCDAFIDFADALAASVLPCVSHIRIMAPDCDLTLSAIDFQAFTQMVCTAAVEARWWAGYTKVNVRDLGFTSICTRPFCS